MHLDLSELFKDIHVQFVSLHLNCASVAPHVAFAVSPSTDWVCGEMEAVTSSLCCQKVRLPAVRCGGYRGSVGAKHQTVSLWEGI